MVYLEIITATGNLYMSSISLKKTSPLKWPQCIITSRYRGNIHGSTPIIFLIRKLASPHNPSVLFVQHPSELLNFTLWFTVKWVYPSSGCNKVPIEYSRTWFHVGLDNW
jgi:hypothetical protein